MDSTTSRTPMTPRQAAEKVGVTERFLRNEVRRGNLRVLRLGRMLRFRPEDIDEYLESRLTTGPAERP